MTYQFQKLSIDEVRCGNNKSPKGSIVFGNNKRYIRNLSENLEKHICTSTRLIIRLNTDSINMLKKPSTLAAIPEEDAYSL